MRLRTGALAVIVLLALTTSVLAQVTLVAYPGAGPASPADQTWTGTVHHGIDHYIIDAPPPALWRLYIPYDDPSLNPNEIQQLNLRANAQATGSVVIIAGNVQGAT